MDMGKIDKVEGTERTNDFNVSEQRALAMGGLHRFFVADIRALRGLASLECNRVSAKDTEADKLKKQLNPEQCRQAKEEAERLANKAEKLSGEMFLNMPGSADEGNEMGGTAEAGEWYWKFEDLLLFMTQNIDREGTETFIKDTLDALGNNRNARLYSVRLAEQRGMPDVSEALRSALLVRLVSKFESMLAGFIRLYILPREPVDLNDKEVQRMLHCVAKKANEVVNGHWNKNRPWNEWLAAEANIHIDEIAPDTWNTVYEALARRNAIVHADGIADHHYRKRLGAKPGLPELGTPLWCEKEYLEQVFCAFEVLADVIAVGLLAQFADSNMLSANEAHGMIYRALQNKRWSEAQWMASKVLDVLPKDHQEYELQVNFWLAQREIYGIDAIREVVEAWEPPEEPCYCFAKAALLLDEDAARQALREWNPGPHEVNWVADWPLVSVLSERSETFQISFNKWKYEVPNHKRSADGARTRTHSRKVSTRKRYRSSHTQRKKR